MFDIGWQELIILLLIALIVVGPKDLPRIVRTAGQWMGKARGYARDFQRTIEEAADATEIDAVKKEIDEANRELATARRDVAEGADGANKTLSEDIFASKAPDRKANGGTAPGGSAGTRADGAPPAAEREAGPAPAARPAAGPDDDGARDSPGRGASV